MWWGSLLASCSVVASLHSLSLKAIPATSHEFGIHYSAFRGHLTCRPLPKPLPRSTSSLTQTILFGLVASARDLADHSSSLPWVHHLADLLKLDYLEWTQQTLLSLAFSVCHSHSSLYSLSILWHWCSCLQSTPSLRLKLHLKGGRKTCWCF